MKHLLFTILFLAGSAVAQSYLSPCDMDWSGDGKLLFVTAHTGQKLLMFDAKKHNVLGAIAFEAPLTGTAVSPDGKMLAVTGGGPDGSVFCVDAETGQMGQTIPVGHTPNAPVFSPDGKTLYVCNRFDNDVSFVDLESGTEMARAPVLREPVAADITPDGKTLFVANHNPDGPADVDYVASKISVIDTQTKEVSTIKLVNGSEGVRGLRVSPDGQFVFATHFMARFLVPTTQLERGWVSTDALSVIRVKDQTLLYTVLLDDVDLGFPNPWAIGFSEDRKTLVVSAAGSHELSLIDLPKLTEKIQAESKHAQGAAHLDAHNNLSFLSGIRRRIQLPGNGPRALAVKGTTAYVAHYYSDTIDIVDFGKPQSVSIKTIELNPDMKITQERQGEIFFNDANLCFQKWLSCATCHPDGRTDALNWDLLNDGMGNPKNVKTMLLAHKTPRAMSLGVRADAETGVRAGLKYIQFCVRPEEDALAIDAYLKSLTPEPSPYLVDGKLSESGERGKQLFESMSCIKCHPAPLFTDLKLYDVGTTKGQDIGKPVDTPTLIEIWRTAPYLHDGSAATVSDLLHDKGHADILKETKSLSDQQLKDLEEYLLSL
jgi:YVTN family beta-propeller protein